MDHPIVGGVLATIHYPYLKVNSGGLSIVGSLLDKSLIIHNKKIPPKARLLNLNLGAQLCETISRKAQNLTSHPLSIWPL